MTVEINIYTSVSLVTNIKWLHKDVKTHIGIRPGISLKHTFRRTKSRGPLLTFKSFVILTTLKLIFLILIYTKHTTFSVLGPTPTKFPFAKSSPRVSTELCGLRWKIKTCLRVRVSVGSLLTTDIKFTC